MEAAMRTLWMMVLFVGCSGDKTDDTTDPAPVEADCSDPAYNPWAGTCVETFNADCWDPTGTCDGTIELTGSTSLVWENGAAVEVSIDFSGGDPFNPGALTDIIASDGTICSSGVSRNNEEGCASRTVYTRADNATLTICIQADQSMTVTCPDGSTLSATADQQQGANACQYGDAEPCTF
jgi:hypothetical protein